MARRIIRKLSASCERLPSSLFIIGVTGKEDRPTSGGGYADIYRASYGDQIVALKYMRPVQCMPSSDLRRIHLVSFQFVRYRDAYLGTIEILPRSSCLEGIASPVYLAVLGSRGE
jgi:hypothetical protein